MSFRLCIRMSNTFPFRIYRPPQVISLVVDFDLHLSRCHLEPGWGRQRRISLAKEVLSELLAPLSNAFITDADATVGHHLFHIPVTQGEGEVRPDAIADDFGGESVTVVQVKLFAHGSSIPKTATPCYSPLTWQYPRHQWLSWQYVCKITFRLSANFCKTGFILPFLKCR